MTGVHGPATWLGSQATTDGLSGRSSAAVVRILRVANRAATRMRSGWRVVPPCSRVCCVGRGRIGPQSGQGGGRQRLVAADAPRDLRGPQKSPKTQRTERGDQYGE